MKNYYSIVSSTLLLIGATTVHASADNPYEIGVRADVRLGSGKPANDILGGAVILRYKLDKPGWWVGASIDSSPLYDVELPVTYFGLETDEDMDSEASSTMIAVFAERHYEFPQNGWVPFWAAGAGINTVSVDDLEGTLSNGDPFQIRIDAGTEVILEGSAGVRYNFSPAWSASVSGLLQHRFADWTVEETESNQTRTIDDYTVTGAYFGVNYRF